LKPSSYGNGVGWVAWEENDCLSSSGGKANGCWECLAMWYPNCDSGFEPIGCNVCSPVCPSGMLDIGVSCQKNSYGRGAGVPLGCGTNQDEDAALCYPICKENWNGVGPVCWDVCPDNWYQCGALCLQESGQCSGEVTNITNAVLNVVLDIITHSNDTMAAIIEAALYFVHEICNDNQTAGANPYAYEVTNTTKSS